MKLNTRLITVTFLIFTYCVVLGQTIEGVTHSGRKTGQSPYPLGEYSELSVNLDYSEISWLGKENILVGWGATDYRYKKEEPFQPTGDTRHIQLSGWRGERVSAQWVISIFKESKTISYEISDLIHRENSDLKITQEAMLSGFVRYVMTDEFGEKGCRSVEDFSGLDSSMVADVIDHHITSIHFSAKNTRSGWLRIWIPFNAQPGVYEGTVSILSKNQVLDTLSIELEVQDFVLPEPKYWNFHLDLWQNPYSVARYYQVDPWSKQHFEYLKETMKPYAEAGGSVITTSIIHKPWSDMGPYDYFETMITWIKKANGSWYYDYTIFDLWIEFMIDLGVKNQINCYSMIPWKLKFQYFDQASNNFKFLEAKPGDVEYEEFWIPMLKSFALHLKEKGWFEITHIAMDERPMDVMLKTLEVIRKADKDFKIALAGDPYPELLGEIDDYCFPVYFADVVDNKIIQKRKLMQKRTTYYTFCANYFPNSFTFSTPAESEWQAWYSASMGFNGFLRWAYNSWVSEPLLDSRYISWPAGDTYLVYPGGRTSIRFERLVEGIQYFEKISILKETLSLTNDQEALGRLSKILEEFKNFDPKEKSVNKTLFEAKRKLNKLIQSIFAS